VRKAVIPAAGLGTRFLPATKAMAKEMLPIVDKPTIQFIVEEAINSGIEDILIVTGKSKRPIEDHFDSNPELEENLRAKDKLALLELVEETTGLNLFFVRQSYPKGLGHAVLQAKAFIGNEPFVVMLGDDLMEDEVPLTKQLINGYDKTHASNIAVMKVPHEDTSKYGIIDPEAQVDETTYNVKRFVEKQEPGAGGEIQLTDAIDTLNKTQRVFAHEFKGTRYDVGDKFGFLKTSIQYGLKHNEVKDALHDYIIELGQKLEEDEK
ncbi:UTP--glucose-1-phosphate uridylyltransferase, partial [Carnobacterium sp.]|uniref:UTP--glucose-1-phosphate uridylyltransferase n=1 Tax=Carnobacterium sp. TaxID=48221 RepID=UPI0028A97C45